MLSISRTQGGGLIDTEFAVGGFKYRLEMVAEIDEVDHGEIGVAFRVLDGDVRDGVSCQDRTENYRVAAFVHSFHLVIPRVRIVAGDQAK